MGLLTISVKRTNGSVAKVAIDPDTVSAARRLPYAPERYFYMNDAILLPLSRLIQTRARPEGIGNAVKLMAAAYAGRQIRRAPIDVQPLDAESYLVLDGNSTVTIATAAGWPLIPCRVVPTSKSSA